MEIWNQEVVIVGAGIAGLATAVALKRVGIRSLVLERAQEYRTTGSAIGLATNGWRVLNALGVSSKLTSAYDANEKSRIHDLGSGEVKNISHPYSSSTADDLAPRVVPRWALLKAMADELPADWIRFSSKLTSISQDDLNAGGHVITVCLEDGAIIKSKVLIGCDGVNSVVAKWLDLSAPVPSGRYGIRGMTSYPKCRLLDHEFRIYIDKYTRAGLSNVSKNELYWFLDIPTSAAGDKLITAPEKMKKKILEKYILNFPSVYKEAVVLADPSSLSWSPLMFRYPWTLAFGNPRKGAITVAGDSMQPMTPDTAQGAGFALEDAVALGRHIGNSYLENGNKLMGNDMDRVLRGYVGERRWRVSLMVAYAFMVGWMHQFSAGRSNWLQKLLRMIFLPFIGIVFAIAKSFNCGELPKPTSTTYRGSNSQSTKIYKNSYSQVLQ